MRYADLKTPQAIVCVAAFLVVVLASICLAARESSSRNGYTMPGEQTGGVSEVQIVKPSPFPGPRLKVPAHSVAASAFPAALPMPNHRDFLVISLDTLPGESQEFSGAAGRQSADSWDQPPDR